MRRPRLVLDTNIVVLAFLWQGKPGALIAAAGEGVARVFTSRRLLDELRATLEKPKLEKAVLATGLTAPEMVAAYRRIASVVRPVGLAKPASRDPDNDHVLACALAARADVLVSGDDDLLSLGAFEQVSILPVATMLDALALLDFVGRRDRDVGAGRTTLVREVIARLESDDISLIHSQR